MEIGAKMATQQEKSPKIPKNLSRPSVNYFKNSLKSLVIMLRIAPGVKLSSYRKNGLNPSWWRCVAISVHAFLPLGFVFCHPYKKDWLQRNVFLQMPD